MLTIFSSLLKAHSHCGGQVTFLMRQRQYISLSHYHCNVNTFTFYHCIHFFIATAAANSDGNGTKLMIYAVVAAVRTSLKMPILPDNTSFTNYGGNT